MDFLSLVFVECYVGSALCDGLITRSEDSFRMLLCLCVIQRGPKREFGCSAIKNIGKS